jgi:nicotinamidase-related amidase
MRSAPRDPARAATAPGLVGPRRRRCRAALLLVDVVNRLDFPGSRTLVEACLPMSRRLERLARRARDAGMPVIYVNDNFGRWESDWRKVLEACLAPDSPGRPMVERLRPRQGDYFVLKPKHSGFYSTTLDLLLRYLGVETLILTGIATDICILFTANDAYMRDYRLFVPSDCCAANRRSEHSGSLGQIRKVLKADTHPSSRLDLGALCRGRRTRPAGGRAAVRRLRLLQK